MTKFRTIIKNNFPGKYFQRGMDKIIDGIKNQHQADI